MDTHASSPPAIDFRVSTDGRTLVAVLAAKVKCGPMNLLMLRKALEQAGHKDWVFLDPALSEVCNLAGRVANDKEIAIGERRDAEISVTVSDDHLLAHVTITPPIGGAAATPAAIMAALHAQGIAHGIDPAAVTAAAQADTASAVLVARGTAPQHGEDTRFDSLIPEVKNKRPKLNDVGGVDYHEIGAFISVKPGDVLMRKRPPSNGTNGIDIYGKPIPAAAGKRLDFSLKLNGAASDTKDPDTLRATAGGQPELLDCGMNINPVLEVPHADLSTGNISFEGTVRIQGDVLEGMKIRASGDIVVGGTVEGAELHAGGDILVGKGIIGRGEIRTPKGDIGTGAARITAGGSIDARFIENAIVSAANSVTVAELISHSEVAAQNQVVVGKKGAKKGHIIGGKTVALAAVRAQVIGSQSHVHTYVEVGHAPEIRAQMKAADASLHAKREEHLKLNALAQRLQTQTDIKNRELLHRITPTLAQLDVDIKTLQGQKDLLTAQDAATINAEVTVHTHAYGGVTITIGAARLAIKDRCEAGRFVLDDHKVAFKLA